MSWGDENTTYNVVMNHEEQYSIWPDYKALPAGWTAVGKTGRRTTALRTSTQCGPTCVRSACARRWQPMPAPKRPETGRG